MKKKNLFTAAIASILVSLAFISLAAAGSSFDYGSLDLLPLKANWTAWLGKNVQPAGYPSEIITEDNTNSALGYDQGYQLLSGSPIWLMQVENFSDELPSDDVLMVFGGLDTDTGSLWSYQFGWDTTVPTTFHSPPLTNYSGAPCPVIDSYLQEPGLRTFTWQAFETGIYYVFRSTQPSGCCSGTPNGHSNGRYQYLDTVSLTTLNGSYIDTDPPSGPAWYLVIHANESGMIDGCHSEVLGPTAAQLAWKSAAAEGNYIKLEWATVMESGLLGFNLYRSNDGIGWVKINPQLILPQAMPGENFTEYRFLDREVIPGQDYLYRLEVLDDLQLDRQLDFNQVQAGFPVFLSILVD
jgi:hypothetical protein